MKKLCILIFSFLLAVNVFAEPQSAANTLSATLNNEAIAALDDANDDEAVLLSKNEKIIPKKIHEEDPTLNYVLDVTYPQITGMDLSKSSMTFNERIRLMVENDIKSFKDSVKRDQIHKQTLPKEVQHYTLKIDYDIDVIHPLSMVSVRFATESMLAGHAHPYHGHRVLNFDLMNNKEIALNDLFKPKAKFLEVFAQYANQKLQQTVGEKDKWMIAEGTKPIAKNFKNWNIEDDAILITFDEYQVAPYVYGPQEVTIPFSELKGLLSKQAEMIASSKEIDPTLG